MSQRYNLHAPPLPTDPSGLRVAFFSDSLPLRNGTGSYYHDLLGHLSLRVAEARVLQPRPGRATLSLPLPGDPTQRIVPPAIGRLRREMAELDPHVVVSVTPGPFGLLGAWLARRRGSRFLTAFHTHFEGLAGLYWGPLRRRLANGGLTAANRYLCRRSASVLVNNGPLADTVRELGAPAVDIVGTPLERAFLETPPAPRPVGISRVCFAGRLAAEKNIDALLEAAQQWPDIAFTIGGDGPLRPRVEAAAASLDNLEYRGWLDRDGLGRLLDENALLVLPSHQETFGSVALEAMARGRPALVSAEAGIHDWPELAPGLFPLRAGESLSAALGRLRELPPGTLEAAAEGAQSAARAFNQRTLEHWLAVLTGNPAGRDH